MNKKIYMHPEMEIVQINASQQLLTGSSLGDPTPPGVGTAPEFFSEDEIFGTQDITTLMP